MSVTGSNKEIETDLVRFASRGVTGPQRTSIRPNEDRRIVGAHVAYDTFNGDVGWDFQVAFRSDFVEGWKALVPPGTVTAQNSGVLYALNFEMTGSETGAPQSGVDDLDVPEPGIFWAEDEELTFLNEHVNGAGDLRLLIVVYYYEV